MEIAVKRIILAIEGQEKVMIYGDYDADGITSTAVLTLALKKLGLKNVGFYIPDREKEDYGLNKAAIEQIIRDGHTLIITCDCGSYNKEEIELAKKLGADVIVTDHHLMPTEIPPADAIINPHFEKKYPFKYLAGVGVVFKLVQALFRIIKKSKFQNAEMSNLEAFEKWLLDLVAIGTVVDIQPLLNENRVLVKYGLIVLNKTLRPGLRALIKEAGLELGNLETHHLYQQIGPRINAAGRLDKADLSLKLLLAESKEEAASLATKLNKINSERQSIVDLIIQKIKSEISLERKVIVAYNQNWPVGVLGIVCQKLLEEYNRPVIIMSTSQDNKVRGSARGPKEFNLIGSLSKFKEYFSRYGGHRQACGFTFKDKEKINEFINLFTKSVEEETSDLDLTPKLSIDAEVDLEKINWDLLENLKNFAPFGEGNQRPKFLARNLIIKNLQWVGQYGQHLKICFSDGKEMIGFSLNNHLSLDLRFGDRVDVVFEVSENVWNGQKEIQMKIIDIKKTNTN